MLKSYPEAVSGFERIAEIGNDPKKRGPIERRIDACNEIAKAFSAHGLATILVCTKLT
ncbi:hypothetical protein QP162_22905 [Sphingomonas aurantiaca]|uniref:hypothetical protein n=1 Tax=Sphingomonas aurantiaca TaxID=185949 RepID=UPI002FDFA0E5